MGIMGQQQGRDEARKFIVTSMKMEINLRPLFWVYNRFLKCQPERAVEKDESCCRGAERESVCISRVCLFCSPITYLAQEKA